MAATNRIAAYSKGLVENGAEVTVITIHPTEPPFNGILSEKLPDQGEYSGIKYIHPSGRYRNKNKILRAIALLTKFRLWRGAMSIAKILKSEKFDAVIMSFDEPLQLYIYSKLIKHYNSKSIFIFDEYPIPIRHYGKSQIPLIKKLKYKFVLRGINGYISINDKLIEYYGSLCYKPVIKISVIIDLNRFKNKSDSRMPVLSYVGNLDFEKDNVLNVVNAFNLIHHEFECLKFDIWGEISKNDKQKLDTLISQYGLNEKVKLKGRVDNDKVNDVLTKSLILVSSQCDNMRTRGGLSTKIGEYICSGTPTIICNIGENNKYFSNKDCYFVNPDNPQEYANTISYIIKHYEDALKIARHGQNTIITNYSSNSAGSKIIKFINSLTNE